MNGTTSVILMAVFITVQFFRVGPRHAMGTGNMVSLLLPIWLLFGNREVPINLRVACSMVGLGLYCFHPQSTFRWKLVATDICMLGLVGVHLLSDIYHDGFHGLLLARVYGEWVIPYLCGRLALQSEGDIRRLLPWAVTVAGLLAFGAIIEAFFKVNVWEFIFGARPTEDAPRDMQRWFLKRAFGPTMQALFFAGLLLTLTPWTLTLLADLWAKFREKFLLAVAAIGTVSLQIAGIFSTTSRGAILAVGLITSVFAAFLWKPLRWPIVGTLGLGLILSFAMRKDLMDALHFWEGVNVEKKQLRKPDKALMTATTSRIDLWTVYGPAFWNAGFLGYGTEKTTQFPVRVPVASSADYDVQHFKFIDNEYLLITLRFGFLGLLAFCMVCGSIVMVWGLNFRDYLGEGRFLSAAMSAGTLGLIAFFTIVWMPHEFGFVFLWNAGAAAGLRLRRWYGEAPEPGETTVLAKPEKNREKKSEKKSEHRSSRSRSKRKSSRGDSADKPEGAPGRLSADFFRRRAQRLAGEESPATENPDSGWSGKNRLTGGDEERGAPNPEGEEGQPPSPRQEPPTPPRE